MKDWNNYTVSFHVHSVLQFGTLCHHLRGIKFSNGETIEDEHEQQCCEQVYVDWEGADALLFEQTFNGEPIIEKIEGSGIRINGHFIPCYNIQNGCYSGDLELKLSWKEQTIDIEDTCTYSNTEDEKELIEEENNKNITIQLIYKCECCGKKFIDNFTLVEDILKAFKTPLQEETKSELIYSLLGVISESYTKEETKQKYHMLLQSGVLPPTMCLRTCEDGNIYVNKLIGINLLELG